MEEFFALIKALQPLIALWWVFWKETSWQEECPSLSWHVVCTFLLSTWLTKPYKWCNSPLLLLGCLASSSLAVCTAWKQSKFTVRCDGASSYLNMESTTCLPCAWLRCSCAYITQAFLLPVTEKKIYLNPKTACYLAIVTLVRMLLALWWGFSWCLPS